MKKILVTGAAGFVGRNIVNELKKEGHFLRGTFRKSASDTLYDEQFIIGNLEDKPNWEDAVRGMDVVIHLAGRAHVTTSLDVDANLYNKINTEETLNLARAAFKAGVKQFIFASSVIVYGNNKKNEYSEVDECLPADSYALSKVNAENKLKELSRETGFPVVIFRLPLVYGPGVKANFHRLIKLMDSGYPLPFRNVNNKRSIIFVGNFASALGRVIDTKIEGCQTFLISDGPAISTPELMNGIAVALKKKNMLFSFPQSLLLGALGLIGKQDVYTKVFRNISVNDSLFRKTFGWTAPYTLQQGLNKTIEWYKSH